jgi:hypothetical protein
VQLRTGAALQQCTSPVKVLPARFFLHPTPACACHGAPIPGAHAGHRVRPVRAQPLPPLLRIAGGPVRRAAAVLRPAVAVSQVRACGPGSLPPAPKRVGARAGLPMGCSYPLRRRAATWRYATNSGVQGAALSSALSWRKLYNADNRHPTDLGTPMPLRPGLNAWSKSSDVPGARPPLMQHASLARRPQDNG